VGEDLERGFEQFIKFGEVEEHLDSLLASLQRYEEKTENRVEVDFITWRGMITKILTVLSTAVQLILDTVFPWRRLEYERDSIPRYDVRILKFFADDSYIEEDIDFSTRRASNKEHALAMYAGYKFEALSTLDKTWDESTRDEIERRNENVVDNIQQYCSVVKTQLGFSSLVIGGEVDCLWGTPPLSKTNKITNLIRPRIQSPTTSN
jgi:RAT1-interacting protein